MLEMPIRQSHMAVQFTNSDLLWWHHDIICFQNYWPFVRGINQLLVYSPHKEAPVISNFDVFMPVWTSCWTNIWIAGDFWCHNAHVTPLLWCVMRSGRATWIFPEVRLSEQIILIFAALFSLHNEGHMGSSEMVVSTFLHFHHQFKHLYMRWNTFVNMKPAFKVDSEYLAWMQKKLLANNQTQKEIFYCGPNTQYFDIIHVHEHIIHMPVHRKLMCRPYHYIF